MTSRDMLEVSQAWKGPLGNWLRSYLKTESESVLANATRLIPKDLEETNERERNFGKGLALVDLLDQIPNQIKDELTNLEKQENTSHE